MISAWHDAIVRSPVGMYKIAFTTGLLATIVLVAVGLLELQAFDLEDAGQAEES